jgi:PKD repeat protein
VSGTSPFTITGLTAGQSYDFWVADVCTNPNDTSGYAGPETFTTPTAPLPTIVLATPVITSVTATSATVDFDASGSLNASDFVWDFGNATGAFTPAPTATYAQNGQYFITLTVSNGCGSVDTVFPVTISGISLGEVALGDALSIFPNPTASDVNVVLDNQDPADYQIELMDAVGRVIEVRELTDRSGRIEERFELGTLPKGMYLIRVSSQGVSVTERVTRL